MNFDIAIKTGTPILLMGSPGVGKTSWVQANAKKHGLHCETVLASIREPADISGLPFIKDGAVEFSPPRWAKNLVENGGGVLFFDEITTAPPAVQASLLRVVLDRVVGDLQLPKNTVIIAAANPADEAAGGWELSLPLSNRFAHFNFNLDVMEWASNFAFYWGNPPSLGQGNSIVKESTWATERSFISSFIQRNPTALLQVPKDDTTKAWPSPRSWDNASRMIAASISSGDSFDDMIEYTKACVGEGRALEYISWRRNQDLPLPEEYFKNTEKELPEKHDVLYMLSNSIVSYVANNFNNENYIKAWRVIERIVESRSLDTAAVAGRQLMRLHPDGTTTPKQSRALTDLFKEAIS